VRNRITESLFWSCLAALTLFQLEVYGSLRWRNERKLLEDLEKERSREV